MPADTNRRDAQHHPPSAAVSRRPAASGRFVLRIDPALHEALREAAAASGVSLNDYCSRKLAAPAPASHFNDLAAPLGHALDLFGDALAGLVAFGSWVRGDAADTSDIDLLVVLDSSVPLARELYRRWDERPVRAFGRGIEPHFVHLPEPQDVAGGLWAEAALDGVVLFERQARVSRRLSLVRRHILCGRLVRRIAHGQPYWAEAK